MVKSYFSKEGERQQQGELRNLGLASSQDSLYTVALGAFIKRQMH
jgi:hypothetical protein